MSPIVVTILRIFVIGLVALIGALVCGYGYSIVVVGDWTLLDSEAVPGHLNLVLGVSSLGAAGLAGLVAWLFEHLVSQGQQPKAGDKSVEQIKEDLTRKAKEHAKVAVQLDELKGRVMSLSSLLVSLSNMAKVVGSTLDPNKVIDTTMENVQRHLKATKASLILIDSETKAMELASQKGWHEAEVLAFSAKMGEGIVGYCAEKNMVIDDESIRANPDLSQIVKFTNQKTHICAPLSTTDNILGVLNVEAVQPNNSEAKDKKGEEMRLITILTSLAAMAIQNARLFKKTQEWATIDALTGLNNRRSMLDFFEKELERADKEGTSVTFFMSDIDHFKGFNDTYGHAIGDFVLAGVAQEYKKICRSGDMAGRYGGEEFGQILPKTNKVDAKAIAESLRKNVESKQFDTEAGKLSVTLSLGVASYPEDGKTLHEVMTAADDMLYVCKESGRNMVCVRGVDKINEKVALKIAIDKAKNIDPDKVPELEAQLSALIAKETGKVAESQAPQSGAPTAEQSVNQQQLAHVTQPVRRPGPPRPPGPGVAARPPGTGAPRPVGAPRPAPPGTRPAGAPRPAPPGTRPAGAPRPAPPGTRPAGAPRPAPPGTRPPGSPKPPGAAPGPVAPRPPGVPRPPSPKPRT